tara:strand:+ start:1576 stop:1824 length:249 start_codon:yes stop_codon:yes gene_type:complete
MPLAPSKMPALVLVKPSGHVYMNRNLSDSPGYCHRPAFLIIRASASGPHWARPDSSAGLAIRHLTGETAAAGSALYMIEQQE